MTITLATPTTVRAGFAPVGSLDLSEPLMRCECGGYLADALVVNLVTRNGDGQRVALVHADACDDCVLDHPAACDLAEITHKTCNRPRPVACGHFRCFGTARATESTCLGDLDACCGCCADTIA